MTNRRLILPLLATALGVFAFSATPAFAGEVHKYCETCSIGSAGPGAGQFEGVAGIAVNSATAGPNAGDVYIADPGNRRIDEFEADGAFVRAWGWGVTWTESPAFEECTLTCQAGTETGSGPGQLDSPEQIAVDNSASAADPSKEDVYVTDGDVVDKFSATGSYLGQITTAAHGAVFSSGLDGVAVDPKGLVWVEQPSSTENGEIDDYSDALANEFLSSREPHLKEGTVDPVSGFAVDSEDNLYVRHGPEAVFVYVARFNSAGKLLPEPGEATPQVASFGPGGELGAPRTGAGDGNAAKTGIAVDPSNDNVYLDMVGHQEVFKEQAPTDIEQLAADGSVVEDFGSEQLADRGGGALGRQSSTGTVYVADGAIGAVRVYPTFIVPGALTGAASDLHTEGSATLNGTVDPEGLEVKECRFEYITDATFSEPYAKRGSDCCDT